MVRAAFEKFKAWAVVVADEWWIDLGEKPRPHFLSMAAGAFISAAIFIVL